MKENTIKKYVREASEELNAVTWPTKQQMFKITAVVLAFTALSAIFIASIDYLFNLGNTYLLSLIS
jgi:preprotein translocase SecE subunit